MFWAKRRFQGAEYAPYQDRLERLLIADRERFAEFIMVSTETDSPVVSDYYIGVPAEVLLNAFDGFERVSESDLPKEIESFLVGDATKAPFKSRFKFKREL